MAILSPVYWIDSLGRAFSKTTAGRLTVERLPVRFVGDERWVISLPFNPGGETRVRNVLRRVRRLSDDEAQVVLGDVLSRFEHRHRDIEEILEENCDKALSAVGGSDELSRSRRICETLAVKLFDKFDENSGDDWPWPENCLSYANGKPPHALLLGGQWMQRDDLMETGLRSLKWLLQAQTGRDGVFFPIGNRGWFKRGGRNA